MIDRDLPYDLEDHAALAAEDNAADSAAEGARAIRDRVGQITPHGWEWRDA